MPGKRVSKPAGCSESEPTSSLVINKGVADPLDVRGRLKCLTLNNCHIRKTGSRGSRGDTQGKPYGVAQETLFSAGTATGGYKETKFLWAIKGVGGAHSTDCIL
jgi:hypothetical protein